MNEIESLLRQTVTGGYGYEEGANRLTNFYKRELRAEKTALMNTILVIIQDSRKHNSANKVLDRLENTLAAEIMEKEPDITQ